MTLKPLQLPSHAPNPLPIETVRDLLGIVRVLYALQRDKGNDRLARELHRAGKQLRRALDLAVRKADSEAHAEAWRLANDAIVSIARVQTCEGDDLSLVVRLATDRVKGRRFQVFDRDLRRQARIKRG